MELLSITPQASRWFAVRIPVDEEEPASVIHCLLAAEDVSDFLGSEDVSVVVVMENPGVALVYPSFLTSPRDLNGFGDEVSQTGANMRASMVLDYYRSLYGTAGGMDEFSVLCGPVLLSGLTARGNLASIDGEELTRVLHLLYPVD